MRRYQLTAKGRGRARSLERLGGTDEFAVGEPGELLDLIYADASGTGQRGPDGEAVGLWHVPTVMAVGSSIPAGLLALRARCAPTDSWASAITATALSPWSGRT